MEFILHPWYLLILALSALINHEQEKIMYYLQVENQALREKLGERNLGFARDLYADLLTTIAATPTMEKVDVTSEGAIDSGADPESASSSGDDSFLSSVPRIIGVLIVAMGVALLVKRGIQRFRKRS